MNKILITIFAFCSLAVSAQNASQSKDSTLEWFNNARLGVYISWGFPLVEKLITETAPQNVLKNYSTKNYKPTEWAKLIQETGIRYALLNVQNMNVLTHETKQDFILPLAKALKENQIKTGLVYSPYRVIQSAYKLNNGAIEWNRTQNFCESKIKKAFNTYTPDIAYVCKEWINENPKNWNLDKITYQGNPTDLRMQGSDLIRFINEMPVSRPKNKFWEFTAPTYNYTSHELINHLRDCISLNGNMLLNISPKTDGSILPEDVQKLKDFGRWVKKHQEVVYKTVGGIPGGHFTGATALSADSTTLYLFIDGKPTGPILVKGLQNKIYRTRIVGDGTIVEAKEIGKMYWSSIPGLLYIDLPEDRLDSDVTVVAILLDSPVKLFREDVKAIESNL